MAYDNQNLLDSQFSDLHFSDKRRQLLQYLKEEGYIDDAGNVQTPYLDIDGTPITQAEYQEKLRSYLVSKGYIDDDGEVQVSYDESGNLYWDVSDFSHTLDSDAANEWLRSHYDNNHSCLWCACCELGY